MGKHLCYYETLGVPRNANDVEIKKAYRRLAMKHHPDIDPSESSKEEYVRICEAYDVLSNAKLKGTFDLYGEEVLKSTAEGGAGYTFDPEQGPAAVFSRFFGTANPYEALNALSAHFGKLTTQAKTQPGQPQEVELLVTLDEVAQGTTKVVQHSRRVLGEGGSVVLQQMSLKVEVKAGQLEGTRYVFEGQGDDVSPGVPPGPLVLVLASGPHPVFSRRGASDLRAKVKLPLLAALTGGCVRLDTLDGRVLSVPLDEVVTPGLVMKVAGEGLPLPAASGAQLKGDLYLEFDPLFPQRLTQQQKMLLAAGLYLPAKPNTAACKALREFEAAYKDAQHGWSSGVLRAEAAEGQP